MKPSSILIHAELVFGTDPNKEALDRNREAYAAWRAANGIDVPENSNPAHKRERKIYEYNDSEKMEKKKYGKSSALHRKAEIFIHDRFNGGGVSGK